MKPQTLFYLIDEAHVDTDLLHDIEDNLSALFQSFCRDHFSFDEALDYPALRLIPVSTPAALVDALFETQSPHRRLTPDAAACCLFLCDDELQGTPLFDVHVEAGSADGWRSWASAAWRR